MDPVVQKLVAWINKNAPVALRYDTHWIVEGIRYLLSGGMLGTSVVIFSIEMLDRLSDSELKALYQLFFCSAQEEVIAEFEKYL